MAEEPTAEQIAIAIISSEPFMWLMCGSNHVDSQINALKPAWRAYIEAGGKTWGKRSESDADMSDMSDEIDRLVADPKYADKVKAGLAAMDNIEPLTDEEWEIWKEAVGITENVVEENCNGYCVCHTPISSKAWCRCCKGDNAVGRVPRCGEPDPSNGNGGKCARALPCPVHAESQ